jgi:large subunit ribosomal protein L7/L12
MADLKAFAEQLVNLTVKEVNELATILKDEYGIEPAAAAVAIAAGRAGGAAVEEKTSFDVILKAGGANKLAVVKLLKLNTVFATSDNNDTLANPAVLAKLDAATSGEPGTNLVPFHIKVELT